MTVTPNRRRRLATMPLVLVVAAFLATGCGGSSGAGDSDDDASSNDRAKQPDRELVLPTPDEALSESVGADETAALTEAGCTLGVYEPEPAEHVDAGAVLDTETHPPTTGQHYADWGAFGLYDEPVDDGYMLHNLEHGGVAAWLGTEVDDATADAIAGLLDDGEKWLVAPRTDLPGLFSGAWAKGLYCPPDALETLGAERTAEYLDAWYEAVVSTGSDAEKDIPAYAGTMKEPTPERDISEDSPTF